MGRQRQRTGRRRRSFLSRGGAAANGGVAAQFLERIGLELPPRNVLFLTRGGAEAGAGCGFAGERHGVDDPDRHSDYRPDDWAERPLRRLRLWLWPFRYGPDRRHSGRDPGPEAAAQDLMHVTI